MAKPRRRELVEPELNTRRKHLAAPRLVHGHVRRDEGGHRLAVRVEHPRRRVRVVMAVAPAHPVQVLLLNRDAIVTSS